MNVLTCFFAVLAIGCRHFDWLDNLREHVAVDEIIQVQVMSERDRGEGDLEWGAVMEECKRELSCVCIKMAQAVGWQPGRPCRPHAPKPGEQRQNAMRTGRAGPHLFTSSDEDSEEDEPEGRRARVSDPWLAPVHATVERDLVWGGYIDSSSRGKPMPKERVDKIEREVNDFHSERMNSPPKTCSLQYWAQASLRYPIVAQAARKYLCIPASSATSERSFSKSGHIVRARRARLSDEHVKELSFLSWNQDSMY